MSIERYRNMYIPICDDCGQELMPEYNFQDAVDAMEEAGWSYNYSTKENHCEACRRDWDWGYDNDTARA